MKLGQGARLSSLVLGLVLVSCGLDTVESVPKPPVVSYLQQSGPLTLEFEHDPTTYAGLNFQGYDLYYKVSNFDPSFANLSKDAQSLVTSNTTEGLIKLGYQRMNGSLTSLSAIPLIVFGANASKKSVTVDFRTDTPFASYSTGEPSVLLYRTLVDKLSKIPTYEEFSGIKKAVATIPVDYQQTLLTTDRRLEVDIFLVAVALSSDLVPIVSVPVPLGTIQDITVSP